MKMAKERIDIWGGFHEAHIMSLFVNSDVISALLEKSSSSGDNAIISELLDSLNNKQREKIKKHMCGVENCMCGRLNHHIRMRRTVFTSTMI